MGGGSLEVAEAIDDHVGDRWVSMPLGALPVEAMLSEGVSAAKRRVDEILQRSLPPELARPVFYPVGGGWRALAKAHMETVDAPVKVVHGYTLSAAEAREFAKCGVAAVGGEARGDAGRGGSPGADFAGGGAGAGSRAEAPRTRNASSFPRSACARAFSIRSSSREEQYLDPLVEGAQLIGLPLARVPDFAPELVPWTAEPVSGETAAEKRLRVAVCALSDIAWRDAADLRAEESFRRLLAIPVHRRHPPGARVHRRRHPRPLCRPARTRPGSARRSGLLTPAERRRAQILGRAILLAYRFSGGVPAVLASARLRIDPNSVRLEVDAAARAPDSEVVSDRLKLLASAIGVKRSEIVDIDAPSSS